MREEYYTDEDGILRGKCPNPNHKEFVGDAIGCPECLAEQEGDELKRDIQHIQEKHQFDGTGQDEECEMETLGY